MFFFVAEGFTSIDGSNVIYQRDGGGFDTPDANVRDSLFKKSVDNSMSQQMVEKYGETMKSVGALVHFGESVGTVLRVGSKYVITAWHLMEKIVGNKPVSLLTFFSSDLCLG